MQRFPLLLMTPVSPPSLALINLHGSQLPVTSNQYEMQLQVARLLFDDYALYFTPYYYITLSYII